METVFRKVELDEFWKAMKGCTPKWNTEQDGIHFYFNDILEGYIDENGRQFDY